MLLYNLSQVHAFNLQFMTSFTPFEDPFTRYSFAFAFACV